MAANYTFNYVAANVTVNQAPVTVTASNTTNTYGTAPAAPTPIYAGFVNSQNSSVLTAQPTCSTTVTATTNVGTPTGTGTCSGAAAANYSFTYVPGNATINPATLTVTASAGTMTYGGTPPTVTAIITGYVNGQNSSVITAQPTCSTSATATTSVGTDTGADTCTGGVAANYTFNHVAANVTVNPATLTVTASAGTMTYGGTPPHGHGHHHRLRQWSELERDHRPADLLDIGHGHDGRGYRHRR